MALITVDDSLVETHLTDHAQRVAALEQQLAALEARVVALEVPPPPLPGLPAGVRGLWLQNTVDSAEARDRVRVAANLGANTVIPFVGVGSGVRFRNSRDIPVIETLDDICDEAARYGLQVIPCLPVKYFTRSGYPEQNLNGKAGCTENWLDMRVPAARALIAGLAHDLATGYPIAGVMLDYIRYRPSFDKDQLTCESVTATVSEVHAALAGTGVSLSASVAGSIDPDMVVKSCWGRMQDWPAWLRTGICEWVSPMIYDGLDFLRFCADLWQAAGFLPAQVAPTVGIHFPKLGDTPEHAKPGAEFLGEIELALARTAGLVIFDETNVGDYPQNATLLRGVWRAGLEGLG